LLLVYKLFVYESKLSCSESLAVTDIIHNEIVKYNELFLLGQKMIEDEFIKKVVNICYKTILEKRILTSVMLKDK